MNLSNEITVKVTCSLEQMYNILENKGFSIVDKFSLEDVYYIPKEVDIKSEPIRKILTKYILIRNITQFIPDKFIDSYNIFKITHKRKNIAPDGSIINQYKKDCKIQDMIEAKGLIEELGFKEIMTIKENSIVYGKNDLKLAIKDIEDGENLIEIETIENNPKLDTIEKLKVIINELQIPIDTNDYFVKKAENKLNRILLGE